MNHHTFPQFDSFFNEINIALLMGLVIMAAGFDIKSRRIPNLLVLAGLIVSLIIRLLFDGNLSTWGYGMLTGFGLFFPLYLLRAMGAGDVKLMAMAGAFLGSSAALGVVLATLLAGGALAIGAALWRGILLSTLKNVRFMLTHSMVKALMHEKPLLEQPPPSAGTLPYGVAIAAGTLIHLTLDYSGHAMFA